MLNFTPEMITKAKAAKSAEELMALAKENNVELTEEEAKTYFEQLNASGSVTDDELDMVAGGACSGDDEESGEEPVEDEDDAHRHSCPKCHSDKTVAIAFKKRRCTRCQQVFENTL